WLRLPNARGEPPPQVQAERSGAETGGGRLQCGRLARPRAAVLLLPPCPHNEVVRPEMGVSQELTPCSGGSSYRATPRPVFGRLRHYREHECTEPDKLHNKARRMPILPPAAQARPDRWHRRRCRL